MNIVKRIYAMLGTLAFWLALPIIRVYLRPTQRVYALLCADGKVLATKSWLSRNSWHLPGGGVRRAESAVDALVRELFEELGLVVPPTTFKPLVSGVWQTDKIGNRYEILGVKLDAKPALRPNKLEIIQSKWLLPSQLSSPNTPAEILAALATAKKQNLLQ